MRPKTVKHVEYEILKYLTTGSGSHLGGCEGLTDLGRSLGVEYSECGRFPKDIDDAKDKVVQKRWKTATQTIGNILVNMMSKRTGHLPEEHPNSQWALDDLKSMVDRAHKGELI